MGKVPHFVRPIPDEQDEDGDDAEDSGTAEYVRNTVGQSDVRVLAVEAWVIDAGPQLYRASVHLFRLKAHLYSKIQIIV